MVKSHAINDRKLCLWKILCAVKQIYYNFFAFPFFTQSKKKPFSYVLCSFIVPNGLPHTSRYKCLSRHCLLLCVNSSRIPDILREIALYLHSQMTATNKTSKMVNHRRLIKKKIKFNNSLKVTFQNKLHKSHASCIYRMTLKLKKGATGFNIISSKLQFIFMCWS